LLRRADRKISRDEILASPAEDHLDAGALCRWLRRAVEHSLLRQDGLGKSQNPFRYRLPDNEERWRRDLIALIRMPELFQPPRR
jgi:hypothetical protein